MKRCSGGDVASCETAEGWCCGAARWWRPWPTSAWRLPLSADWRTSCRRAPLWPDWSRGLEPWRVTRLSGDIRLCGETDKRGGTLAAAWLSGEEGVPSPAPVALLHQRFPLLLAGVLLPLICLVQDLLGSRSPFETVAPYFLAGGFAADVLAWLSGGVVLWEKVHRILIGFVRHSAAGPVRCLIKLWKTRHATLSKTNWRIKRQKFYQCLIALASFTHHRLRPSMWETQILTYVAEFPVVSAHTRCRGPLASAFSWVCLCWGAGKGGTGSGPWCPPPPAGGCCAAACNLWSCGQHAMDPRWVQVKHRRVCSRYHSKPDLLHLVTEWMVVFSWWN